MKSKIILAVISFTIIFSLAVVPASAMSASEWNDFYDSVEESEDGVSMYASSAYQVALDPEYIGIDMSIQALTDAVDSWISLGFLETAEESLEVLQAEPKGVFVMFRNAGGRLSVSLYNTGMSEAYFENVVSDIEFLYDDLMIEWVQEEEDGAWNLYINKIKINEGYNLDGIVADHFTNEDGKTFVSFAAFDAGPEGQHHEMRTWTINSITNEKPEVEETPEPTEDPVESETPNTEEPSDEDDNQLAPPAEDTTPDSDSNGSGKLVGIVIVAAIVVVIIATLVIKKRKK